MLIFKNYKKIRSTARADKGFGSSDCPYVHNMTPTSFQIIMDSFYTPHVIPTDDSTTMINTFSSRPSTRHNTIKMCSAM